MTANNFVLPAVMIDFKNEDAPTKNASNKKEKR